MLKFLLGVIGTILMLIVVSVSYTNHKMNEFREAVTAEDVVGPLELADAGNGKWTVSFGNTNKSTAALLLKEYSKNQISIQDKLKDKRIILHGWVKEVTNGTENSVRVVLGDSDNNPFGDTIGCFFPMEQRSVVAGLQKGQHVKVSGVPSMSGLGILLDECAFE